MQDHDLSAAEYWLLVEYLEGRASYVLTLSRLAGERERRAASRAMRS